MNTVATFAQAAPISPMASPFDLPTGHKVLALGIMCVGFFIAYLDIQIVAASIKEIGGGLSASQDEVGWVQTSYLIAEIIVIPLSGWLSRVMSTRWLFTASAAGFTLASLLCAYAWDIQSMIVFRALQGFLGGSMIPMVFTSALTFFQGKQRVVAASLVGALASLAPTFGPVVGGWITDNWSWHGLFYINVAPGLLVTVLVPVLVKIDRPDLTLLRGADYLGIVLMALFLGCFEYVLEEGPRWDWFSDETIRYCAWISLLAGAGFVVRSLTHSQPVVDLRALKIRNFALGSWFSFVTGLGLFSTAYLTPLFLGRIRGFDAWQIGTALLSAGVFQIFAVVFYSTVANRIDLRWLMMFGLACFAVAMWLLASVTHDWGWRELLIPQAFRGFAQQFCVAPVVTLTLGSLPPERLKSASGLFNLMRNLGGAIGIAACGTVLNDRANLHFQRMPTT
ncbi:DHA2 family efflux MFS transporter permease subunit [Bradyrhizobium sp. 179]|uniref:DHA2 family efflux MFS transporter permease subunit n=1 Tax=Bradyrhizobium sp. 179 TaxID=2782648 RepID=UPI001FF721F4|nr:DHA2 family efflux MFS transporter permease subunit [Bradyrhizobium sp. 179]